MRTLIAATCALALGLASAAQAQMTADKAKTGATTTASSGQMKPDKAMAKDVKKPRPKQGKYREHGPMLESKPK